MFAARNLLHGLVGASFCCALCCTLPGQAQAINDDAVLRRMDTVLQENTQLRDEAWKARKHGHEATQQAEEALAASNERVEKTRVEALAHVAGVSETQVEELRKEGRSWGQAAGDLGVHPGFLGIGKAPLYEPPSRHKAQTTPAKVKHGKKARKKAEKVVPKKVSSKRTKTAAEVQPKVQTKAEPGKKHKRTKHKN
jgi:hypothetical protein